MYIYQSMYICMCIYVIAQSAGVIEYTDCISAEV